ncbi:MAG: hypothetical protein KBS52_07290 [Clostridiales bacterium]|nr:hypothetical protein [Candidatus Equinaster intestinalis]
MKNKRQEKIIELIENNIIVTQDELQYLLVNAGFNVTQSTVSRDIKEMRIVKAQDIKGIYRYIYPKNGKLSLEKDGDKKHLTEVFSKGAFDIKYAMNNIVIKCYTGMASSTCVALDTLFEDRIVGSLAGDDTIIVIMKDEPSAKDLCDELTTLIK